MPTIRTAAIFLFAALLFACKTVKSQNALSPNDFAELLNKTPNAQLIDVRTPDEFTGGHLRNAINIDFRGKDFNDRISKLNKDGVYFVYCLSGGRSGNAAAGMRSMGFKQVYELQGGLMKWRADGLPEEGSITKGMTIDQYNSLLIADKPVLVDFYAPWCQPCKMLAPYIEQIVNENSVKLVVIRINADENPNLMRDLKIGELPTLFYYKDNKLSWKHVGFISKEDLVKALKK